MKSRDEKRKVTVQVYGKILDKLNELATAACLQRDAYLDLVLANEAAALEEELGTLRNSEPARTHIKHCLSKLMPRQAGVAPSKRPGRMVSLKLTEATAAAVDKACLRVNVVRDAFINRVLFMLVARREFLFRELGLDVPRGNPRYLDGLLDSGSLLLGTRLLAIRQFVADDPFIGIREALKHEYGSQYTGLHRMVLGRPKESTAAARGLAAFNVYLEDHLVPSTDDFRRDQLELADL